MPDHQQTEVTGVILSGGKNLRMGQNKAFIKIEGVPIIQRILNLFHNLFKEIIIVTNQPESYYQLDARIYTDLIPDRGVLGGLYTGLFYSSFFYSFVTACDMPYLRLDVITHLLQRMEGYDVTLPKTEDGLEPLHAVYSKNCLEPMAGLLKQERARIVDLFPSLRVNILESDEILSLDPRMESFFNLNTPGDLIRYQKRTVPHD